jgi:hypothetical protein
VQPSAEGGARLTLDVLPAVMLAGMYPEKTVPFDRSLQGLEKLDWETEWLPATKVKLRVSARAGAVS